MIFEMTALLGQKGTEDANNLLVRINNAEGAVIAEQREIARQYVPLSVVKESAKVGPPHETVLVVGGTDGSGTRRVVQILTQFGVSR